MNQITQGYVIGSVSMIMLLLFVFIGWLGGISVEKNRKKNQLIPLAPSYSVTLEDVEESRPTSRKSNIEHEQNLEEHNMKSTIKKRKVSTTSLSNTESTLLETFSTPLDNYVVTCPYEPKLSNLPSTLENNDKNIDKPHCSTTSIYSAGTSMTTNQMVDDSTTNLNQPIESQQISTYQKTENSNQPIESYNQAIVIVTAPEESPIHNEEDINREHKKKKKKHHRKHRSTSRGGNRRRRDKEVHKDEIVHEEVGGVENKSFRDIDIDD